MGKKRLVKTKEKEDSKLAKVEKVHEEEKANGSDKCKSQEFHFTQEVEEIIESLTSSQDDFIKKMAKKKKPKQQQKKKAALVFKPLRADMFNLTMIKHTEKRIMPGQYAAR